MAWKQVRAFNQSTAGKKAGYCLQNVRLGFGIPVKYSNATGAWNNTQQHKNRDLPAGVTVPLYYSYKADGHINVQLPDGRVWSDGNIYANLSDYERKHPAVKYLGWGESVNGIRVIEYINEPQGGDTVIKFTNEAQLKPYYMLLRGNEGTVEERKGWIGKTDQDFINNPNTHTEARNNAAERAKVHQLQTDLRVITEQFNALKESKPTGQGATQKQLEAEKIVDNLVVSSEKQLEADEQIKVYIQKYGQ